MMTMLKDWQGQVEVNGTLYDRIQDVPNKLDLGQIHIVLHTKVQKAEIEASRRQDEQRTSTTPTEYLIKVKAYMTRKATPEFDFMAKWNNDNPMPIRIMQGVIDKETKGMVHMTLHGMGRKTCTCLRCGRDLENPVSRYYGIGPECMKKLGIVANIDEVESIKEQLVDITWSGWIIKSAILEQEEV